MPRDDEHDKDQQRYQSVRHKPAASPSPSRERFDDHPWASDGLQGDRKHGRSSYHARQKKVRNTGEDRHSGNHAVATGEIEAYSGPLRRYERTPDGRLRARKRGGTGAPPTAYENDRRIAEQVTQALSNRDDLNARELVVRIEAGTVSLSGRVPTQRERTLVERIVRHLPGVSSVVSEIRTAPGDAGT